MFGQDWVADLPSWVKALIGGLFLEYVVVLLIGGYVGLPIWDALSFAPSPATGFRAWQPITHLLVPTSAQAFSVIIGLLVLLFTLPTLPRILTRAQILEAFGASFVAAVVGAFLFNGLVTLLGTRGAAPVSGWFPHANSALALFGLALPATPVRVGFILTITGQTLVIACTVIIAALFLAAPNTMSFYDLSAVLGVIGWWFLRGPGRRRREVLKPKKPEHKFRVLQGGRDETVH